MLQNYNYPPYFVNGYAVVNPGLPTWQAPVPAAQWAQQAQQGPPVPPEPQLDCAPAQMLQPKAALRNMTNMSSAPMDAKQRPVFGREPDRRRKSTGYGAMPKKPVLFKEDTFTNNSQVSSIEDIDEVDEYKIVERRQRDHKASEAEAIPLPEKEEDATKDSVFITEEVTDEQITTQIGDSITSPIPQASTNTTAEDPLYPPPGLYPQADVISNTMACYNTTLNEDDVSLSRDPPPGDAAPPLNNNNKTEETKPQATTIPCHLPPAITTSNLPIYSSNSPTSSTAATLGASEVGTEFSPSSFPSGFPCSPDTKSTASFSPTKKEDVEQPKPEQVSVNKGKKAVSPRRPKGRSPRGVKSPNSKQSPRSPRERKAKKDGEATSPGGRKFKAKGWKPVKRAQKVATLEAAPESERLKLLQKARSMSPHSITPEPRETDTSSAEDSGMKFRGTTVPTPKLVFDARSATCGDRVAVGISEFRRRSVGLQKRDASPSPVAAPPAGSSSSSSEMEGTTAFPASQTTQIATGEQPQTTTTTTTTDGATTCRSDTPESATGNASDASTIGSIKLDNNHPDKMKNSELVKGLKEGTKKVRFGREEYQRAVKGSAQVTDTSTLFKEAFGSTSPTPPSLDRRTPTPPVAAVPTGVAEFIQKEALTEPKGEIEVKIPLNPTVPAHELDLETETLTYSAPSRCRTASFIPPSVQSTDNAVCMYTAPPPTGVLVGKTEEAKAELIRIGCANLSKEKHLLMVKGYDPNSVSSKFLQIDDLRLRFDLFFPNIDVESCAPQSVDDAWRFWEWVALACTEEDMSNIIVYTHFTRVYSHVVVNNTYHVVCWHSPQWLHVCVSIPPYHSVSKPSQLAAAVFNAVMAGKWHESIVRQTIQQVQDFGTEVVDLRKSTVQKTPAVTPPPLLHVDPLLDKLTEMILIPLRYRDVMRNLLKETRQQPQFTLNTAAQQPPPSTEGDDTTPTSSSQNATSVLDTENKNDDNTEDNVGLSDPNAVMEQVVAKNSEYFSTQQEEATGKPDGILFCGAKGSGKTSVTKCLTAQLGTIMIVLPMETLSTKWRVDNMLYNMMNTVIRLPEVLLMFDQLDIFSKENVSNNTSLRELLSIIIAIMDKCKTVTNVVVLGSCRNPAALDVSLVNKFEEQIVLKPPSEAERTEIFSTFAKQLDTEECELLASKTPQWTAGDIKKACANVERAWLYTSLQKSEDEARPINIGAPPVPAYLKEFEEGKEFQ